VTVLDVPCPIERRQELVQVRGGGHAAVTVI
jgi:hypothetical protein